MKPLRGAQLAAFGLLALLMLIPATLPVPVLRELIAERYGVGRFATSAFMAINMVGAFLAAPLAGLIADRWGRRRQLIIGALLADAGLFWIMSQPGLPFVWCFVARFFEGVTHITSLSLLLGLAAARAGERRGAVMGTLGAGLTLGVAIGAPIGGQIGKTAPLAVLPLAAAISLAGALLAALILREGPTERRPALSQLLGLLRTRPLLLAPLGYAFVDRFTVGFFTGVFPQYARESLGLASSQIGMLLGAFLIPFALLSYPFGRLSERWGRVPLMAGGSALYGLLVLTLGWWPTGGLWWLMPLLGITSAVMFVPSMVLVTELTAPETRSTALGAFNAAGSLGFIVGPLVGGALAQGIGGVEGYRWAFVTAGASELLCVLITLPLLRTASRAAQ